MGDKSRKGCKKGIHLKMLSNIMCIFLSQKVISIKSVLVNITIVFELTVKVYKWDNMHLINKITFITIKTLLFFVMLLIMNIEVFHEFLKDKLLIIISLKNV